MGSYLLEISTFQEHFSVCERESVWVCGVRHTFLLTYLPVFIHAFPRTIMASLNSVPHEGRICQAFLSLSAVSKVPNPRNLNI